MEHATPGKDWRCATLGTKKTHPLGFQRTLANHAGYGSQSYVSVPNPGLGQVSPLIETPVGTLGKTIESYKEYQMAKRNMGQSSGNERSSQFDHKSH
jgi:hypothetical protein